MSSHPPRRELNEHGLTPLGVAAQEGREAAAKQTFFSVSGFERKKSRKNLRKNSRKNS